MTEDSQGTNEPKTGKRNPAKLVRRKSNQIQMDGIEGATYFEIISNGQVIRTRIDGTLMQTLNLITWSAIRADNGVYFTGLLPNAQEGSEPISLHELVFIMSNDLGIVTTLIPDHIKIDTDLRSSGKALYMKIESRVRNTGLVVDHKDRDTLNNRASNLRLLPQQLNSMNSDRVMGGSSKYPCVSFHRVAGKFRAMTTVRGEQILLGFRDSQEEAAVLVLTKLMEIHPTLDWATLAEEFFPGLPVPGK
jgi:hypothetical protein